MFAVPANGFVSLEALIVAEVAMWGETYASVADNMLVSEQRERAGRRVVYQHLDVDVPCFHPGGRLCTWCQAFAAQSRRHRRWTQGH